MHALVKNGVVEKYPYSIGMLRKDNPNTSFPKKPTDELLKEWGLEVVVRAERPTVDYTKNISEGTPVLVGSTWTQVWNVSEASPEEITERTNRQSEAVRQDRNQKLARSDWTQVDDTPLTNDQKIAWATYRQQLRDITDHQNFPFLSEGDWPSEPA